MALIVASAVVASERSEALQNVAFAALMTQFRADSDRTIRVPIWHANLFLQVPNFTFWAVRVHFFLILARVDIEVVWIAPAHIGSQAALAGFALHVVGLAPLTVRVEARMASTHPLIPALACWALIIISLLG